MFVLDTDVISGLSPLSRKAKMVRGWLDRHENRCHVSAATLGELRYGADRLRLRQASRKAGLLDLWIDDILATFAGRFVALDERIADRAGVFLARAEMAGFDPGFVDACIAATADTLGYEVITFNARHFAALGVPHRSPFSESRDDPT